MLVQAMGGLMAITGEPDGGPVLCNVPVIDTMGALMAGQGIVTALLHRERTGEGQRVDVSLLNGLMLAHAARLPVFWATGEEPARLGSAHPHLAPFQAFMAKDGWIYVAVLTGQPLGALLRGHRSRGSGRRPALRLARRPGRSIAPPSPTLLAPIFRERTVADWMAALEAHDVLCAPVNRYADLEGDPQIQASEIIVEEQHPRAGRFRTIDTADPLREDAGHPANAGRPRSASTPRRCLRDAGFSDDELTRLRAAKIVA